MALSQRSSLVSLRILGITGDQSPKALTHLVEKSPSLVALNTGLRITKDLVDSFPKARHLRSLNMDGAQNLPDLSPLSQLANLRSVSFWDCKLTNAHLDQLSSCTHLEEVNFDGEQCFDCEHFEKLLKSNPQLRAVTLPSRFGQNTTERPSYFGDNFVEALQTHCPNLNTLSVRNNDFITDEGLAFLDFGKNNIYSLDVRHCPCVRGTFMNCLTIKTLHMEQLLEEEAIDALSSSKEHLENVFFTMCGNPFADNSAQLIAQNCPNLKRFVLWSSISDVAISYLLQGCPLLEELEVWNGFTNAALLEMGQRGKQLKQVSLRENSNITDEGIAQLLNAPKLEKLTINLCRNLTDATLQMLIDTPHHLKRLELFYCDNIGNVNLLKQLMQKHPRLAVEITSGGLNASGSLDFSPLIENRS